MSDDDLSQFDIQSGECCSMLPILKNLFHDEDAYNDIFKSIQLYIMGIISMREFNDMTEKIFEENNGEKEREKLIRLLNSRYNSRRQLSWCCRPSTDLVQARCKRIGSYLMLPEEYPAIISTGRDGKLGQELNDTWISVASGSEDFSFKVYRKNIYEEQLCKNEDDRFEYDISINRFEFAISIIENTLKELSTRQNDGYYLFEPLENMHILCALRPGFDIKSRSYSSKNS